MKKAEPAARPSRAHHTLGSYSKGIARRKEILQAALDAYASAGYAGPSLNAIADAVGLTVAGVLHYFPSREHLLVEILRARDEADLARAESSGLSWVDATWVVLRGTMDTPGLVKLFVDMSAAAADPHHPAHDYLTTRTMALIERLQEASTRPAPDWRIPVLIAAAEGLQIQWLRDPTIDIVAPLQQLYAALTAADQS